MHAYRKSKGDNFPCYPRDVCHEWDGDLNSKLANKAVLGDYRKIFERSWQSSVKSILNEAISSGDKFAISGYFANLMVCTPTWRRLGTTLYDRSAVSFLSFSKRMQEEHGGNPGLPTEAIKRLERGEIVLRHDPDFVKASAILKLFEYAWLTYHQDWLIVENSTDCPFVTSDNPVAILQPSDPRRPATRYLPITPALCLEVRYDRTKLPPFDLTMPPIGHVRKGEATTNGAKAINKLTAQCAEDLVFCTKVSPGIETLVRNCANFRMELDFREISAIGSDGVLQIARISARETRSAA